MQRISLFHGLTVTNGNCVILLIWWWDAHIIWCCLFGSKITDDDTKWITNHTIICINMMNIVPNNLDELLYDVLLSNPQHLIQGKNIRLNNILRAQLSDFQQLLVNAFQWRHNGHGGVSNHQPYECLLKRLFTRRSKKTAKLRVTGLCGGNSPVTG